MQFIESIRKYQTDGDRAVLSEIREAMRYDFLQRGVDNLPGPAHYVALRCLRLIGGRLSTIKYTLAENGLHTRRDSPEYIFAEFARMSYVDLTVENYPEHEAYLREFYGPAFPTLRLAYERLTGQQRSLWSQLTDEIVDEHWPDISAALEYALNQVDCSRSEREIVRYINRATRTAYVRSQFEGLRRVRRDGRTKYVEPRYFGPIYAIFGTVQVEPGSSELIDRMMAIIEEDAAAGDFSEYNVDLRGGYRIKNRYMARRLGMHEVSVSRAVARLKRAAGVK